MNKLFLLFFLIPIFAYADGYNQNGLRITRTETGKHIVEYSKRHDMSFLRNYMTHGPGSTYQASGDINSKVTAPSGVVSSNTVKGTVSQEVSKSLVRDNVWKGAKSVGKGALKLANPFSKLGAAYLAWELVDALAGRQGFKWNDEKGDWFKDKDDNTYVVFVVKKNSLFIPSNPLNEEKYKEFCAKDNIGCEFLGFANSQENGIEIGKNYCKTVIFDDGKKQLNGDGSLSSRGECATQNGFWTSSQRIHVVRWVDYVPFTRSDFEEIAEAAADAAIAKWINAANLKESDWSEPEVLVLDGQVAQTPPYTDPKTGKAIQAEYEFKEIPEPVTGKPKNEVIERIKERPDLTPDSPEAPRPNPDSIPKDGTGTGTGTGTGDKDKPNAEQVDLCKEHPDILACDKQPEQPSEDEFSIPHETKDLFFTPDTIFPTTGSCPAPVSFRIEIPFAGSKTFEFDTMPICEIARRLRSFLIAIAWLVTAVFCLRSFSLVKG
ncbi:hypothetical protein MIS46_10575 [Wielerella bovis]|uniref:IgG-binding virulence factor TspB family protein n=1 Tax=Wielerella bovis TaxID=2917790 RepID=UPI00201919EF|nr:IgG-binding virulence factor TspB family protein [Wielerella bovis]ULJ62383.1 hypothetical protein MIS46_10575 [Wielerella bovis]